MKTIDTLYCDIPPSRLREDRNADFIACEYSPFWLKIFDWGFITMLKRAFFTVRIQGLENYDLRNKEFPNIYYAPHCCWWDGITGYYLYRKFFKTNARMMIEELRQFPILSKLGAFSVNKQTPQACLKALNFAIDRLKNSKENIWIFPQGIIRPPDYRPIKFESGLSYVASKVGEVNLVPIATKYLFLRKNTPEVLIKIGKPIVVTEKIQNRKDFHSYLESSFEELVDSQLDEVRQGHLKDYKVVYQAPLSPFKWIESVIRQN